MGGHTGAGVRARPPGMETIWSDKGAPIATTPRPRPSGGVLTLLSPSGARGSVIQDPNLEPEVLMVTGSLMPVSLPQARREPERRR